MANLNRLKIVLVEKGKTGKWLAGELGKSNCTVSKWCSNSIQPDLPTLDKIAKLLDVDIKDLLNSTEKYNQHIMAKAKPFIKWVGGKSQEFSSRTALQILYVGTITSTDYGKEGYKYRSKGHNSSYN